MAYKLTIVKIEPNPRYDEKAAEDLKRNRFGDYNPDIMLPTVERQALAVDLTEEEFKAVKRAVMEAM